MEKLIQQPEQEQQLEQPKVTTERKNIVFYSNKDANILKHLNKQNNQSEYIKSLIKDDIKRSKKANDLDSIVNSSAFEKKVNSIVEQKVQNELNKYIAILSKCYNITDRNAD